MRQEMGGSRSCIYGDLNIRGGELVLAPQTQSLSNLGAGHKNVGMWRRWEDRYRWRSSSAVLSRDNVTHDKLSAAAVGDVDQCRLTGVCAEQNCRHPPSSPSPPVSPSPR